MAKPSRPRPKGTPDFDPGELDDLIHIPAVGSGVSSHLLSRSDAQPTPTGYMTTVGISEMATVVSDLPVDPATVVTTNPAIVPSLWRTETGAYVTPQKVRPIQQLDDILSDAEKTIYFFLRSAGEAPGAPGRIAMAGYDQICRATGLSRKTVQRTIARLLDKDCVVIATPADIYSRTATSYRVLDIEVILARHEAKGRRYVARIGPGLFYVTPVVTS